MTAKYVKVKVLDTVGPTIDCTVGKIYDALLIEPGMLLVNRNRIDEQGVVFFDDTGEQCAIRLSFKSVEIVQ